MTNKNKRIKNKSVTILRRGNTFKLFFSYIHIPCLMIFKQGFLYIYKINNKNYFAFNFKLKIK